MRSKYSYDLQGVPSYGEDKRETQTGTALNICNRGTKTVRGQAEHDAQILSPCQHGFLSALVVVSELSLSWNHSQDTTSRMEDVGYSFT